jgi:hypothetical protein
LVQRASTTIMDVAIVATQNKAQFYAKWVPTSQSSLGNFSIWL